MEVKDEQRREIRSPLRLSTPYGRSYVQLPPKRKCTSSSRLTFYNEEVIPKELSKYKQQIHDCENAEAKMKKIEILKKCKGLVESAPLLTNEIALLEGLHVSTSLVLIWVIIFLDRKKYVRGKLHPGEGNIVALVEQATSLLRKFVDCIPFLLTPNTVNFANKRATDAIVSQVKQPLKTTRKRKSITKSCAICLQDIDIDHMFLINGCLHCYCISCMNKHVEAKLLQGMLPECSHDGCKSKLKIDNCKKFLTPNLYDLMSERVKETTIPITAKIYCPNPECSTLMSKAEVQISAQGGAVTCT